MSFAGPPHNKPIVDMIGTPEPEPYEEATKADFAAIKRYFKPTDHVPICFSSQTDLIRAVENRDPEKLRTLLAESTVEINKGEYRGETPLHFCMTESFGGTTKRGQMDPLKWEMITILLEHGVDLDPHGDWKMTPLHLAAARDSHACKLMVEARASVLELDHWGQTPLHTACKARAECLYELMQHPDAQEAKMIKDRDGMTPLMRTDNLTNPEKTYTVQVDTCRRYLSAAHAPKRVDHIAEAQKKKEEAEKKESKRGKKK
eukprot:CAMPEP_0119308602 /NCGR_PEP_ID=MMETSP1333-20130426/11562_1 /TAXON_ID=418940 /ORGANISM="Scyphosphaera apsteinii, Strain RCC1455" /LENGTH=259 /DNA_ID=CAMNT_0007312413 /DNA_START=38 /DNA_END=817 /DNA_ORIENTATION=+